ncbi:MAG: hypothetical protein AB7V26_10165 [Lysobacterales bacterium]
MQPLETPTSERLSDGTAAALAERWRRAQPALEWERLQRLRGLSERDAARQFAQLLQPRGPYPLRSTSGLVEQQRILARLRQNS